MRYLIPQGSYGTPVARLIIHFLNIFFNVCKIFDKIIELTDS